MWGDLKYSKLEMYENPSNSDVGLSSNSLHASVFMAVGEILMDSRLSLWFLFAVMMVFNPLYLPNDVHNVLF